METNLRPLTLGEILDRTAQLYRTNFVLFAGIYAVTNGIVLVLFLLFEGISPAYRSMMTGQKYQPGVGAAFILLGIAGLLGLLLYGVSTAAITRAVAWLNLGKPATIRAAYSSILPRLGRYLWLMTLASLIILGIALLAGIALSLVMVAVIAAIAIVFAGSAAAAGTAGFVVGFLFYVVVLALVAFIAARYALGIPACVVEDLKARKALRRSAELSQGSRGRIFLLFLLVGIVQIGLVALTQSPFYLYKFRHHLQIPLGLGILSQIINVATNTLVGPILSAGLTLFYFDQRVRKEGYDIEWMMQAAGLAAESAPAAAETKIETKIAPDPAYAPTTSQTEPATTTEAPGEPA
jgi:hypothetical protein